MVEETGAPAPRHTGTRGRVLVVEDEFLVAIDIEGQLRALDCSVIGLVASMQEARSLIEATRPDLVVLDVALADGRSTPLARELRDAGIPFIITSGYGAGYLEEEIFRNAPRLDKPGDVDSLRLILDGLLPP
jgi:CheY-like chemotaxis protein